MHCSILVEHVCHITCSPSHSCTRAAAKYKLPWTSKNMSSFRFKYIWLPTKIMLLSRRQFFGCLGFLWEKKKGEEKVPKLSEWCDSGSGLPCLEFVSRRTAPPALPEYCWAPFAVLEMLKAPSEVGKWHLTANVMDFLQTS